MDDQGPEGERPPLRLVRGTPPRADRFARFELDERIRSLRLRGQKAYAISQAVGVPLQYVTRALRRFEREYVAQADRDVRAGASLYRQEMIARYEALRREAWTQVELAKDSKKKTQQEMLKDATGKVTHQRGKVDTIPGETSPGLIAELRQIELILGRLHGVEVDEPPAALPPLAGRDLILVNPSEPIDRARIDQLNEVIRKRRNGGAGLPIVEVEAVPVPSNGTGKR